MPFISQIVHLLKSVDLHYFTGEVLVGAEGRVIEGIAMFGPAVQQVLVQLYGFTIAPSYGEDFAVPCQEHVCSVGDIFLVESHPFILLPLRGQREHERFPGTKVVDILIALLSLPPVHGTKGPKHLVSGCLDEDQGRLVVLNPCVQGPQTCSVLLGGVQQLWLTNRIPRWQP